MYYVQTQSSHPNVEIPIQNVMYKEGYRYIICAGEGCRNLDPGEKNVQGGSIFEIGDFPDPICAGRIES
jgi:hypothetical protein